MWYYYYYFLIFLADLNSNRGFYCLGSSTAKKRIIDGQSNSKRLDTLDIHPLSRRRSAAGTSTIISSTKTTRIRTPGAGHDYSTTVLLNCTFDDQTICSFSQDQMANFDWRINTGATMSGNTGPANDHTQFTNSGVKGYYIYIESSQRKFGEKATIVSPILHTPQRYFIDDCRLFLTFYYNMYGSGIGGLEVFVKTRPSSGRGRRQLLWRMAGSKGPNWIKAGPIALLSPLLTNSSSVVPSNFQLEITGKVGISYLGDIAVDDIMVFSKCRHNSTSTSTLMMTSTTTTTSPPPTSAVVATTTTPRIIALFSSYSQPQPTPLSSPSSSSSSPLFSSLTHSPPSLSRSSSSSSRPSPPPPSSSSLQTHKPLSPLTMQSSPTPQLPTPSTSITTTKTAPPSTSNSSDLNIGLVVGAAVGGVCILIIAGVAAGLFLARTLTKAKVLVEPLDDKQPTTTSPTPPPPPHDSHGQPPMHIQMVNVVGTQSTDFKVNS